MDRDDGQSQDRPDDEPALDTVADERIDEEKIAAIAAEEKDQAPVETADLRPALNAAHPSGPTDVIQSPRVAFVPPFIRNGPPPRIEATLNNNNNTNTNWNTAPPVTPLPSANPELWVETKTDVGKAYYYHAVNRETTWTKPEGANIRIVTQVELEAMNAAKKNPPASVGDIRKAHESPKKLELNMGAPPLLPQFGAPPPRFGVPPFGMPPPGFGAAFPPAWGMQTPPNTGWMPPQEKPLDIDPGIVAKANEWTEHKAPDGRQFFYNASKGESVWEKPPAIRDLEAARIAAATAAAALTVQPPTALPPMIHHPGIPVQAALLSQMHPQMPIMPHQQPQQHHHHHHHHMQPTMGMVLGGSPNKPPLIDHAGVVSEMDRLTAAAEAKRKADSTREEEEDKAVAAAAVVAKHNKPLDKSRPISSTPISGTPWCVVWTGDGRVFFYNPSTKTSVWERPEELNEKAEVDKAVSTVPEQLLAGGNNLQHVIPSSHHNKSTTAVSQDDTSKKDADTAGSKSASPSSGPEEDEEVAVVAADSEETVSKQAKVEVITQKQAEKKAIAVTKEAAIDAEAKASRERALVPLETRVTSFKEMLREKDVSAFSTWEKELHKIVFDPRYLLLTSRERKQVFEKYVKDRAEEERREKRNKMRQRRDDFRALMEAGHLHGKSTFSEFSQKYGKDERYKGIEKMRERESFFNEYIVEVRKREKDDKVNRREQIRKEFIQLLRDHPNIDRHCRWMEIRKWIESDARYRAIDSGEQREELFHEYCKQMKEERRRAKAKDREPRDKEKRSKDKKHKRDRSAEREPRKEKKRRTSSGDRMSISSGDHEDGEHPPSSDEEHDRKQKEKERQLRAEASIKEREKEVQRTLAGHLRDRDFKREHHKRGEAIGHFNALLTDLVRNADLSWKEVKKQLRKDHRWELVDSLEREERERLFNEHITNLSKKKRENFKKMLDEIPNLELTASWKEVKRQIRDDPRYVKYNSSEKCEREFREYIRDKTIEAKTSFRELLQECKLISHKSMEQIRENPAHLREIEEILRNDKRYLDLEHVDEERTQIIVHYLEELQKRGPPPPPTAATSARRKP